ncbi:S4 domain-containing protein [Paraurantiacibacter namhicola]|uniref:Ribosome-associated heat shock protein Hsp15 n=1 Tax=Paraurantiacibacter namhicola TaxID=645517 RepID=A0A1C7D5J3_9SPHN|nr:S4 domain-containing protein [Paraurantiacibacter namhicola]ANU06729.1 ribosome-associated heat shock protein Hsp15 [Paraurantiacibacter namhicola]
MREGGLRLDKLLCYLRFARSRAAARDWIEAGHFRRNGQRIEQAGQCVWVDDILTMPLRSGVLVVRILAIPQRRGSPAEAREHYHVLDPARPLAIAGREDRLPDGRNEQGHAAP